MDLRRAKNPEKLALCRRYFLVGFFLLPFVWFVNCVWFFKEAFRKPPYEEQAQIKSYVIKSGIGMIIYMAIIVTWATIFQIKRVEWDVWGEKLSLILPLGRA